MSKKLSEMTLEELWQLFPIVLKPHDERWREYYEEQADELKNIMPTAEINHIGSTAIGGIWAKPIVDILVETDEDLNTAAELILKNGWTKMSESENRISFNKGYTENGFADKVFHLHLRKSGDNDELYFRDYLIAHPAVAKKYEALKLSLWKKYEHNRDAYTDAKTEFIKKYTSLAKQS